MNALMLGVGTHAPRRKVKPVETEHVTDEEILWTTLDMLAELKPDVVFDLNCIETSAYTPEHRLPFPDETFDEIHAYDVMEHYGKQGDFRGFFTGWRELWRIIKPGGYVIGVVPLWSSKGAWSDPGHTRVITDVVLSYLCREWYKDNLGHPNSPLTDYRHLVDPCWWKLVHSDEDEKLGGYYFGLQKIE